MDPHRILKSYVYLNLIQRGLVMCGVWVVGNSRKMELPTTLYFLK